MNGPETTRRVLDALETVIRGKRPLLKRLWTALVSGGHVLIEDVPGLGKTTAAKALGRLIGQGDGAAEFRRIQFTPDLLPYDITGVEVYDPARQSFRFQPGPVFSQILLADEINRTSPKVQSALLEVMEEGTVTVGGTTHELDPLFFVVATQNPIEMEGTYPLPAAQLDRFLMRLSVGYPDETEEIAVLTRDPGRRALPELRPVVQTDEILALRAESAGVSVSPELARAVRGLLEGTRRHKAVHLGLSPRSGVLLLRALRVHALLEGRSFVTDSDLLELGPAILCHRLILKPGRTSAAEVIDEGLAHAVDQLA